MRNAPTVDGTYVPRLGSLAKIPGVSLRKQDSSSHSSSNSLDTSLPPAFTVVLGGIPSDLVTRLFSSTNPNTARIFSAPPNYNISPQFSPKAAAVIAAPLRQSIAGGRRSLFTDLQNGMYTNTGGSETIGTRSVVGGRRRFALNAWLFGFYLSTRARVFGRSQRDARLFWQVDSLTNSDRYDRYAFTVSCGCQIRWIAIVQSTLAF